MNELRIKNNNVELHYLLRVALDEDVFYFDELYVAEDRYIILINTELSIKLTILLDGVNNFRARIKSKNFYSKEIKNWKEYINFMTFELNFSENNFLLN